jgi:hypothetical protein
MADPRSPRRLQAHGLVLRAPKAVATAVNEVRWLSFMNDPGPRGPQRGEHNAEGSGEGIVSSFKPS